MRWCLFACTGMPSLMRPCFVWQHSTVCYAWRVNHAGGTEQKQNQLFSGAWYLSNLRIFRANPPHKRQSSAVIQRMDACTFRLCTKSISRTLSSHLCAGYARRNMSGSCITESTRQILWFCPTEQAPFVLHWHWYWQGATRVGELNKIWRVLPYIAAVI